MSNSSSSSFIVGFDRLPETVEELREMLFPGGVDHREDFSYYRHAEHWTPENIAERVFKDLQQTEPDEWGYGGSCPSLRKIVEEIGTYDIIEMMDNFPFESIADAEQRYTGDDLMQAKVAILDEWLAVIRRLVDERLEDAHPQLVGKQLRYFHYSDEDGEGVLEHCETFENLPHVKINHH